MVSFKLASLSLLWLLSSSNWLLSLFGTCLMKRAYIIICLRYVWNKKAKRDNFPSFNLNSCKISSHTCKMYIILQIWSFFYKYVIIPPSPLPKKKKFQLRDSNRNGTYRKTSLYFYSQHFLTIKYNFLQWCIYDALGNML